MINKIPKDQTLDSVDIWFQDEARFGQQNTTTRLWAEKGSRPRAVKQQQFLNAYLFGAVCPANGNTEALVVPFSNKEGMKLHMEQISKATPNGRHSVVEEFDNLSIIKLPAYSPELNPIEQVWQWLRQNELANKCFKDYDDIVESCCDAWNSFRSDINLVKNICFRDWLNFGG